MVRMRIRPRIPFSIKLYFFLVMIFVAFIVTIMSFFGTPAVKHTFDIDYEVLDSAYQKKDNWIKDLAALRILLNYDWKNFSQAELDKVDQLFASNTKPEDIVGKKNIDEYNDLLELYMNTLDKYAGYAKYTIQVPCSSNIVSGSGSVVYDSSINQNIANATEEIRRTVNGKSVTTKKTVTLYKNADHNVLYCNVSGTSAEIKYKVFEKTAYFPIPGGYSYSFSNDFGAERTYGGKRSHEGIDVMADRNTPLIAMEDCKIERIGWNELGGNRINMVSLDGKRRYYYAHLEKYQSGLDVGTKIKKGDILGYVGSSGYGPPGSDTGSAPHLHIQIWVSHGSFFDSKEQLINPYNILKFLEDSRK